MLYKIWHYVKTLPARTLRSLYRPIRIIRMEEVVDRMGNSILRHELLSLFQERSDEEMIKTYQEYIEKRFSLQKGEWLVPFLGYPKDIDFWITPWGGARKPYYPERHLPFEYSQEYIRKLKCVRDSLQSEGYLPEKYGYITGELLINEKNERRFVVWNGHRRVLTLAYLGCEKVAVEISGGDRWTGKICSHRVLLRHLKMWKNVRRKLYTESEAKAFFSHFFTS